MFPQTLQFPPTDPSRAHWVDGRLNGSPLSASEGVCALWRGWNLCRNLTFGWRVPPFDINSTDGGTYCFIWLFPAANKVAWFFKKNKFKQRKTRSWNLLHINQPHSFCNSSLNNMLMHAGWFLSSDIMYEIQNSSSQRWPWPHNGFVEGKEGNRILPDIFISAFLFVFAQSCSQLVCFHEAQ